MDSSAWGTGETPPQDPRLKTEDAGPEETQSLETGRSTLERPSCSCPVSNVSFKKEELWNL